MTDCLRPKILHICKVYIPVKGGIQNVVHSITSLLTAYDHSVITTGHDGAIPQEVLNSTEVIRCRSYLEIASLPVAPTLMSKIVELSRQAQLIAVHYPFPLADLSLLFAFRAPPIVMHWHSNIVAQKKLKWLVAPLTYVMMMRANAIVATSTQMIEHSSLLRRFRKKVHIIPYGLPPAPRENVTAIADEPFFQQGYFILVGRHVSYKGIDIAIRALKETSARLVIVGNGPLFDQHKKLANELGLEKRISFKPNCSDDDVVALLRNANALVVSSVLENEAFALVQLEAMRLAKAVINTNLASSVPLVARDQREALTVEPGNVSALAQAIQQLDSDPAMAKRLGKNGLQRFNQRFTADKFGKEINKLYTELISTAA